MQMIRRRSWTFGPIPGLITADHKELFPEKLDRAYSTTGSDRGSLGDHDPI